jgi:hypothetical protein
MQADQYPAAWRPKGAPEPQPEKPALALQLAIEQFISSLSEAQLSDLLARTRPGGR